jgi:hypothetical protein
MWGMNEGIPGWLKWSDIHIADVLSNLTVLLQEARSFISHGTTVPSGQGPSHYRGFTITPHSVGLLWMCGQTDAETSTWQHTTQTRDISMPPAGFEPTIPASERPQTHVLDRAATGIGMFVDCNIFFIYKGEIVPFPRVQHHVPAT